MLANAFSTMHSRPDVARRPCRPRTSGLDGTCADRLDGALPQGAVRTVNAKEHVFCEGDPAAHVYRVEVGHVCIYRMMPDGRRQVIDFAYPGDFIGLGIARRAYAPTPRRPSCTRLRSYPTALRQGDAPDATSGSA